MKKFLLGTITFALFAGSAIAADLRAGAPGYNPSPAPAYSWTGFYLAAGGGYGMWAADTTTVN
jgi:outer membrane immunogenic protein